MNNKAPVEVVILPEDTLRFKMWPDQFETPYNYFGRYEAFQRPYIGIERPRNVSRRYNWEIEPIAR